MYKLRRYILLDGLNSGLHEFNRHRRRNMKLVLKITGFSCVTGGFKAGSCAPCRSAAVFRLKPVWSTDDIQAPTSCSCGSRCQAD